MELFDPAMSIWLLALIAIAAVLYSSVGHGGASGYLAAMAPAMMKPAALTMNIFVTTLVLLFNWTTMRGSAAIAAAFILFNSMAGLAGYATTSAAWPPGIPLLVATAFAGALLGSELGVRQLAPRRLRQVLCVVLVVAGAKMIATA